VRGVYKCEVGVGAQFDWVRFSLSFLLLYLLPLLVILPQRNLETPPHVLLRSRHPPIFIRKDTMQKRDSFDSFSDMSASNGGISPLEYDAEKARMLGAGEYDGGEKGLTLGDMSGMLPDYEERLLLVCAVFFLVGCGERGWRGGRGDRGVVFSPRERAYPHPAGARAHARPEGVR
jgi:hypothetical protein